MSARRYLLLASGLVIVIFAVANLLAQSWLRTARADFTEARLYTLSEGSRATLSQLSEPIDLTLVYTRSVGQNYPAVRAYAVRVRELLDAYGAAGRGNIRLREIDPAPFSEAEDEALAAGLAAVATNGGDPLYFGLIGRNSIDDERVIAFLAPEQESSFEYDLTRMITRLDRLEPPRIGLLTTLPGMSAPASDAGYVVLRDMAKSFTVATIDPAFVELPVDMDVLMIAHPPALTDMQLWHIDQFVLRNGRALILLDPAAKTAQGYGPFNMTGRQIRSDLNRFAGSWGVTLDADAVADTQTALSIEADAGEGRSTVVRHPLFLSIPPSLMSQQNLVAADISRSINLGAPGRFILSDTAPGAREVLAQTGPAPSAIEAAKAASDLSAGDTLNLYTAGTEGPAALAVQLTGALVTAFPDGQPVSDMPDDPVMAELARAAATNAAPHIATSATDALIILIADADMLDDGLYMNLQSGTSFADNGTFILNALDSLSGGSQLMSLRARAPGLRPMVRVEKMRAAAQAEFFGEQARLEARLASSQQRLEQLQTRATGENVFDGAIAGELSDEERGELARLREDIVTTRASLRQIERDFRREIDGLEFWLKAFTILCGPLLIGLLGLFLWWRRRAGGAV